MASDTFKISKKAEENLLKILDYYTDIDETLAKRFFEEIRVCFTKVFPYGIFYIVRITPKRKITAITIRS